MTNFLNFSQDIDPEIGAPAENRRISGNPVFTTWNLEERDKLYAGIWHSTEGKFRIEYDEWEYCYILEGYSIVQDDEGETHHLRAGSRFVIRPGFKGTWEVIEPTKKDYVILLP